MPLSGWQKWAVAVLLFVTAIIVINAVAIWFNLGPVAHSSGGL